MKYYKIVNPKGHHGLVYKEGINEDPLPFNPSGDCQPGGIYFAKEDILTFIDCGTKLYEVEPLSEIYENPGTPKKYKAKKIRLKYIGKILNTKVLDMLIKEGANVNAGDETALRWASENGHLEVVKYLVNKGADIHTEGECVLRWSANNGHLKIVKYLLNKGNYPKEVKERYLREEK